jgi:hypothetical protein
MLEHATYPRFARARIDEALADTPAVFVNGPRQCGKTTLVRHIGDADDIPYVTFDDEIQLAAALVDPVGFVANLPSRVVLDEIQRAPSLFLALKAAIDRDRRPGRFLLTGSSNILFTRGLADSLAGRMAVIRLHPLAQCEIAGRPAPVLDALFGGGLPSGPYSRLGDDLIERVVDGGYPAALARRSPGRRAAWYRDYLQALVDRDARDLARISSFDSLPRLMRLAAGQTARLINLSELAAPFQLSRPTIRDYTLVLERLFLLEELPPWHTNRLKRLVKTAKLHVGDSGLAAAILGADQRAVAADRALFGQLVETFVYQELSRAASWNEAHHRFHHFRDKDGVEVDVVIERDGRQIAGVEVKAGSTVTAADFRGLRKLQQAVGTEFTRGFVLYDGDSVVPFGVGLYAVPIAALWTAEQAR